MNTLDKDFSGTFKKTAAIITAGGTSSRFGSNKLLEAIEINGVKTTVISATVEKFLPFCEKIVIPCHDDIKEHILSRFRAPAEENAKNKISFAPFGETRQKSVFMGLLELEKCPAPERPDIVLIHDGARPFIEPDTIKNAIEKLKEYKGVCVGVYAVDTIKITDANGNIIKTVDRNTVFQAQTPQGFDFKTILDAHKKLQNENFTDDSSMLEALNIPVYALKGTISNKKITFREDLA